MENFITMFYGIPVTELQKDIKSGKYILKSEGNINGNINAQTVIVYGNVSGSIKADEMVIINGNSTGPVIADNIVAIKNPEEQKKTCESCKYYQRLSKYQHLYTCNCDNTTKEIKCEKYQKKENPAKDVVSPDLPVKKTVLKTYQEFL